MRIGILKTYSVQGELLEQFGDYPDMFQSLLKIVEPGLDFSVYDIEAGDIPKHLDAVDAYLITGSQFSVYEDRPWIHALAEFVRRLHRHRKKLLGICFGHQMVAHALGGKAEKSIKGWGLGAHSARFQRIPDWHDGGAAEFHLLVSHQDQVITPAPGSEVLAGSDFCENAVCQLGRHILTFQGHPEFVAGYSASLLKVRRASIGEDNFHSGSASLSQPLDRERVARWMLAFLRQPS